MVFLNSRISLLAFILSVMLIISCSKTKQNKSNIDDILYDISFESISDMVFFKPETEISNKEVSIKKGSLDIDAVKGATVWFKEKLSAPIKIEYTAVVIDEGGSNDRVSDLNCFFMAIDPYCPSDIFKCPDSIRTGVFVDYHRLRTYYVGYGGNNNSTTRMRRYPGFTGERPLLKEHDLGSPYLIKPNIPLKVEIKVQNNQITYAHDGKIILKMNDTLSYREGWFAFRTVRNHMKILNFKITEL